jgi:DNA-directed RNA polymerase subunit beta
VIPSRGAWLEFEIDKRDMVGVRIDRKRKQSVTVLLKALGWSEARILEEFGQYESMRQTLEKDHTTGQDDALLDIYRKLRPGEPPTREAAQTLLENLYFNPKRYDLAKVGRYKINKKLGTAKAPNASVLDVDDIVATIRFLVACTPARPTMPAPRRRGRRLRVEVDDIDHFGNRRLRTVGELIQNQVRTGLSRMERVVRERMTTQDVEAITPQTLINIRPVVASIKEFFGTSQLSQFMDQTNPLAGLTHKRRLSALGPVVCPASGPASRSATCTPRTTAGCARSRPRGPEHRPDRLAVDVRADQPVRLRRDPVPQGHEGVVTTTSTTSRRTRRTSRSSRRRTPR